MNNKNILQIFISLFFITFVLSSTIETSSNRCYVLALEGGGDKGAYQVGVLKGLVEYVPNNETKWEVVTGISVGSLNAASISIFDIGDEAAAVDFAVEKWRNIKGNSDIFQNWWLGPLYGLFAKTSLYDTTPLHNLLTNIVQNNTLKRKFVIGATNIKSGAYERWDETTLNKDEYVNAILSSAAFPVIFPNIDFRNNTYMDGGVKIGVDIASGINKCFDLNYTQDQITVDAVLLSSDKLPELSSHSIHPLEVLMRVFEIYGYDNSMRDIDEIVTDFPRVKYRYIIFPTKTLPSGAIPLTFSPQSIEKMIAMGIEDAQDAINKGEGVTFNELIEKYRTARRNKNRFSLKKPVETNFEKIHDHSCEKIINGDEELSFLN